MGRHDGSWAGGESSQKSVQFSCSGVSNPSATTADRRPVLVCSPHPAPPPLSLGRALTAWTLIIANGIIKNRPLYYYGLLLRVAREVDLFIYGFPSPSAWIGLVPSVASPDSSPRHPGHHHYSGQPELRFPGNCVCANAMHRKQTLTSTSIGVLDTSHPIII